MAQFGRALRSLQVARQLAAGRSDRFQKRDSGASVQKTKRLQKRRSDGHLRLDEAGLAVVIVYRGIVFWLPFLVGAVVIQRIKAFMPLGKRDLKGFLWDRPWPGRGSRGPCRHLLKLRPRLGSLPLGGPAGFNLGVVEAAVTVAFALFGIDSATGLAVVIVYRGIVFWRTVLRGFFVMRCAALEKLWMVRSTDSSMAGFLNFARILWRL